MPDERLSTTESELITKEGKLKSNQLYVKGPVPVFNEAVNEPSEPPLHKIEFSEILIVRGSALFISIIPELTEQPLLSVTFTVYVPVTRLIAV